MEKISPRNSYNLHCMYKIIKNTTKIIGKNKYYLIVFFIILVASTFRLWELGKPDINPDELHYINESLRFSRNDPGISVRHHPFRHPSPSSGHPFLGQILTAVVFKFAPPNTTTSRLVSAISGILTVSLLFFLNKSFSKKVKIFAALFLAISPFAIRFSRDAHLDSLFCLLTTSTAISIWRFWHGRKRIYLVFAGLASGLAISTKLDGIIALLLASGLVFICLGSRKKTKEIIVSYAFLFIPALVISFILNSPKAYLDGILHPADPAYNFKSTSYWFSVFSSLTFYTKVLFSLLSPAVMAIWLVSLSLLFHLRQLPLKFLFFWKSITLSLFIIHIPGVSGEYGILPAIPPILLTTSYFLNSLNKSFKVAIILIVVLSSFLYSFWFGLRIKPVSYLELNYPYNKTIQDTFYQKVIKKVNQISKKNSNVFILPQESYPLFMLRDDLGWSYHGDLNDFSVFVVNDSQLVRAISENLIQIDHISQNRNGQILNAYIYQRI